MRVVALSRHALVLTSRIWRTNSVALRAGDPGEAMLVDSPCLPDELETLPAVLDQAGFRVDALIATHADFDHMLGRLAFPGLALGVGEPTLIRIRSEPGRAQRELRDFDEQFYLSRPAPLTLGQVQSLPVPGWLELGDVELELHLADGHTSDGTAIVAPHAAALICGDYLSDVEIPVISPGGAVAGYRATLARLAGLVEAVESVVPGHGSVLAREQALRILDEDLAYLDALERGDERPALPPGRGGGRQRRLHAENLAACA